MLDFISAELCSCWWLVCIFIELIYYVKPEEFSHQHYPDDQEDILLMLSLWVTYGVMLFLHRRRQLHNHEYNWKKMRQLISLNVVCCSWRMFWHSLLGSTDLWKLWAKKHDSFSHTDCVYVLLILVLQPFYIHLVSCFCQFNIF